MTQTNHASDFVLKADVVVGVIGHYKDDRPEGYENNSDTDLVTLKRGMAMSEIADTHLKQLAPDHFQRADGGEGVPDEWRPEDAIAQDIDHFENKAMLQEAIAQAREDGVPFVHDDYVAEMEAGR